MPPPTLPPLGSPLDRRPAAAGSDYRPAAAGSEYRPVDEREFVDESPRRRRSAPERDLVDERGPVAAGRAKAGKPQADKREKAGKRGKTKREKVAAAATKERRRRRSLSRRTKIIASSVLVLLLVAGLAALAYLSPLMSVRQVRVEGLSTISEDAVRGAAQVPEGRPLLRVDTAPIAQRVATLPQVESATVDLSYPSAVVIKVTERTPAVRVKSADGVRVLDRLGVAYLSYPAGKAVPKAMAALPELAVAEPGPKDPTTLAAVAVAGELPAWLRPNVLRISGDSPANLQLKLRSGRTVVWGGKDQAAAKASTLKMLLDTVQATEFNVSSPDNPSVR